MSLERKIKNNNIRGLYRGINEFIKGYQSRNIFSKMRMVIDLFRRSDIFV